MKFWNVFNDDLHAVIMRNLKKIDSHQNLNLNLNFPFDTYTGSLIKLNVVRVHCWLLFVIVRTVGRSDGRTYICFVSSAFFCRSSLIKCTLLLDRKFIATTIWRKSHRNLTTCFFSLGIQTFKSILNSFYFGHVHT